MSDRREPADPALPGDRPSQAEPALSGALQELRRVLDAGRTGGSPAVRAALLSYRGCEAVFSEGSLHALVRLDTVVADENRVLVAGTVLLKLPSSRYPHATFFGAVTWEWFRYSTRRWTSGPMGGWTVCVDEASVREFPSLVAMQSDFIERAKRGRER